MKTRNSGTSVAALTLIAGLALAGCSGSVGSASVAQADAAGAPPQTFVTAPGPGTYTVPAGTKWLSVKAIGANGGGDSYDEAGGAGGIVYAYIPVTPGQVIPYYVGHGGNSFNGGDSTNFWVNTPYQVIAGGGGGGPGGGDGGGLNGAGYAGAGGALGGHPGKDGQGGAGGQGVTPGGAGSSGNGGGGGSDQTGSGPGGGGSSSYRSGIGLSAGAGGGGYGGGGGGAADSEAGLGGGGGGGSIGPSPAGQPPVVYETAGQGGNGGGNGYFAGADGSLLILSLPEAQ